MNLWIHPSALKKIQNKLGMVHVYIEESQVILSKKNPMLLDFSLTVKAALHECVFRTGQP